MYRINCVLNYGRLFANSSNYSPPCIYTLGNVTLHLLLSRDESIFLPLNLDGPCDLFWSTGYGRRDRVPVPILSPQIPHCLGTLSLPS